MLSMPMALCKMYNLADSVCQRLWLPFKGTRSWRRLIANTPLSLCLAEGRWHDLPGSISVVNRLGGWASAAVERSTCWEVYTAPATDMQVGGMAGNEQQQSVWKVEFFYISGQKSSVTVPWYQEPWKCDRKCVRLNGWWACWGWD